MKFTLVLASFAVAVSAQSTTITASAGCASPAADVLVTRSNVPAASGTPCPAVLAIYPNSTITIKQSATAGPQPSQFTGGATAVKIGSTGALAAVLAMVAMF